MKVAVCGKGTRESSLPGGRKGDLQRVKDLQPLGPALAQVGKQPFLGLDSVGRGDLCLAEWATKQPLACLSVCLPPLF